MPDVRRLLQSLKREVSKTSEKIEKLQQTAIEDSLKQYKIGSEQEFVEAQ